MAEEDRSFLPEQTGSSNKVPGFLTILLRSFPTPQPFFIIYPSCADPRGMICLVFVEAAPEAEHENGVCSGRRKGTLPI